MGGNFGFKIFLSGFIVANNLKQFHDNFLSYKLSFYADYYTTIPIIVQPYSMIVLYSRDHKGVGMAQEKHHPNPASLFPHNDEAVLVR